MSKYYAVKVGRKPGVYTNWDDAKANVDKFPNATFKSFPTLKEAKEYIGITNVKTKKSSIKAYVDGSFMNGKYGSGVLIVDANNKKITTYSFGGEKKDFLPARNVAGECLASLKAMQWALKNKVSNIEIIYDYIGIEKWINDWKTNEPISKFYKKEYESKYKGKINVKFVKVKSHTGNEGNEIADQLAKAATK
ncbi:MAG: ribonuclease H family protein [Mycoplasmataceae bacterium]|nr:ribonuclease H family protein [Mycoplasmataceae bacterium]